MHGPTTNYIRARAITQVGPQVPKPQQADIWVGSANQIDDDGNTFITLEIKPAWGELARVRLSLNELRDLGELILNRLGATVVEGAGDVHVSVPEGTKVEINYT